MPIKWLVVGRATHHILHQHLSRVHEEDMCPARSFNFLFTFFPLLSKYEQSYQNQDDEDKKGFIGQLKYVFRLISSRSILNEAGQPVCPFRLDDTILL